MWVAAGLRGGGIGALVLAAAEDEGRARGCTRAHLDTFSYQARPFYEKHGWRVFATLDDYPKGHQRFSRAFPRKDCEPMAGHPPGPHGTRPRGFGRSRPEPRPPAFGHEHRRKARLPSQPAAPEPMMGCARRCERTRYRTAALRRPPADRPASRGVARAVCSCGGICGGAPSNNHTVPSCTPTSRVPARPTACASMTRRS